MNKIVIGLVISASILAGSAAFLTRSYLSQQNQVLQSQTVKVDVVEVLVAARDLPLGTTVTDNNTRWIEWPKSALQDDYLVKTSRQNQFDALRKERHVTRRAFAEGELISRHRLYKASDPGFLRGVLAPGMRAVSVRSSAETASSGFILPGDRVDVLLTHSMLSLATERLRKTDASGNGFGLQYTSETIIENLRVLAIDQNVDEFEEAAQVGKTVLLEASPRQAEILYTANAMGKLSMVLRSAELGRPEYGRGYSTDLDVSPILSNFKPALKNEVAQEPVETHTPTKTAANRITVYRGVQTRAVQ